MPGEVSLAHNGVLFLDELPEFHSDVLEVLRQPLEEGEITVSRVSGSATYPAGFMLVCAMNPCKCGWYGHPSGRCRCSEYEVKRYRSRISGPLLDRIDIIVEVPALDYDELKLKKPAESSADIKQRVNAAREIQNIRYKEDSISSNARMNGKQINMFCNLSEESE
ncbi:MAG: ATP-binding protein, partial [Bacillota bacterium]